MQSSPGFLVCTAPPSVEPLTLDEAKSHVRVTFNDLDAEVMSSIVSAREFAEKYTRRALITQTWQLVLDRFPCHQDRHVISLDRSPVQSVASIQYLDMVGVWQTMPSSDYVAELQACPGRIGLVFGKIWPITMPQIGSVKVVFDAGYGNTPESVPELIKTWMKYRIGALFENTSEVVSGRSVTIAPLPFVDRMLDPFVVETL